MLRTMSASQWSGTPHGYASNVNPAQKAFECAVCKQHKPAGTPCVGHCNHNRAPLQTGLQSGTVPVQEIAPHVTYRRRQCSPPARTPPPRLPLVSRRL